MALSIPSIVNPYDSANPIAPAYAWLSSLGLDLAHGAGQLVLSVHPREDAWMSQPIARIPVTLGQDFPTLPELMADPEFAAAYAVIGGKLYAALLDHPQFAGSTIV